MGSLHERFLSRSQVLIENGGEFVGLNRRENFRNGTLIREIHWALAIQHGHLAGPGHGATPLGFGQPGFSERTLP